MESVNAGGGPDIALPSRVQKPSRRVSSYVNLEVSGHNFSSTMLWCLSYCVVVLLFKLQSRRASVPCHSGLVSSSLP